jgi:putative transposase
MSLSASEKVEVIRMVEGSALSIRKNTGRAWYQAQQFLSLVSTLSGRRSGCPSQSFPLPPAVLWNKLPESVKEQCLEVALQHTDKSPRELAWHIGDEHHYFISESSVYRILKYNDLITSPAYILLSASDSFHTPTKRINELWQTDFTYFKVIGWGWYHLSTVLDDYSRFIISWKLTTSMDASDVKDTLDQAIDGTGVTNIPVRH